MAKCIYRFCSGLLAVILLFLSVTPCYAAEGFGGGSVGGGAGRSDFFTWTNGFGGGSFGGGAGRDEAAAAYNDYVGTLPATGYNSEGNLIWSPSLSDCVGSSYTLAYPWGNRGIKVPADVSIFEFSADGSTAPYPATCEKLSEHSVKVYSSATYEERFSRFGFSTVYWKLPFDCSYKRISSPYVDASYRDSSGKLYSATLSYDGDSAYSHGNSETQVTCPDYYGPSNLFGSLPYAISVSCIVYTPQYSLIPDTAPSANTYNTTTRPTSITGGNYGVVGDNNEITKVEDNSTIVNETNNTYYNPATGTAVPITKWSYDYSDRSYKVTLESGDTATITYGDETISIVESSGNTVTNNYTIYYLVEGSGTDTPVDPPAACTHNWTETSTTPATCTVPGSKLLTCSLCSQTKTESISALGHDWEVKKTVTTEYDDTGQLVQQGYTVFECGTCHEQYKSEDGALPPAVTPGTGTDLAAVDALKEKLKIAADALLGIFDKLPELFTGFTDFLAAVFPFVPTEFITIFELGLFLLIAAAALRKFLS